MNLEEHLKIREVKQWTSYYDKDGNFLLDLGIDPQVRKISELSDNHLHNIVTFIDVRKKDVPNIIKNEILLRIINPKYKVEDYG